MRGRRGVASIAANPVLIGAATTLVILVAVFLSYSANKGLPFVPTYQLSVRLPDAQNLVKGNEVRIGGNRVGVISQIDPVRMRNGAVQAALTVKLETSVRPLPADSTFLVRPRSVLGLKYLEITKGTSTRGFPAGATVPARNATPTPVDIDDFLNTFDDPTRQASRVNLLEFGNALAGRGEDLNVFVRDLDPLLSNLLPVARNLSSPRTHLAGFFGALDRAASIVAPAAQQQAALFANLDTTFNALAQVAPDLQRSISGGPAALDASIRSFRISRPFLRNTETLFAELRPGVQALGPAARILGPTFRRGVPTLLRSPELNRGLIRVFQAIDRFSVDPLDRMGVNALRNTAAAAGPSIAVLRPEQQVCNYVTLWFRNVSDLLSEGDRAGTWERVLRFSSPNGPNNEGGPASAPADGEFTPDNRGDAKSPRFPANHLHANPLPNTPGQGRPTECEAGNEPYTTQKASDGRTTIGKTISGTVPGSQGTNTEHTKRNLSNP